MATIYKGASIYKDGNGGSGGISEVIHDDTLTGNGTTESPLSAITNVLTAKSQGSGERSVKGAFNAETNDFAADNLKKLFAADGTLIGYLAPTEVVDNSILQYAAGRIFWGSLPIPNVDVWEDVTDKLDWVNVDDNRSTALLYRGARRLVINVELAYSSEKGTNATFLAFNDKLTAYMGHSLDIIGFCSYNTENTEISNVDLKSGVIQCRDNRIDWRTMDENPKKIWGQIEIPLTAVNI